MADYLIETISSNPYEMIVADTTSQMTDLDKQIEEVTSSIKKLEKVSPTSPTLSSLRERLSSLQSRRQSLSDTNNSAKDLMKSYNDSMSNANTLQGIYELKEKGLNSDKNKAENEYNKMEDETRRIGDNYVNALGNATKSENAIINSNAARNGASAQSTAEARARNYLNAAQTGFEASNQVQQNINAIREGKINTNAGYSQLSQSNADNTLRQQVLNDFQASEAQKDRDLQERLTNKQLATQRSISSSYNNFNPKNLTAEQLEAAVKYYIELANENNDDEEEEEK